VKNYEYKIIKKYYLMLFLVMIIFIVGISGLTILTIYLWKGDYEQSWRLLSIACLVFLGIPCLIYLVQHILDLPSVIRHKFEKITGIVINYVVTGGGGKLGSTPESRLVVKDSVTCKKIKLTIVWRKMTTYEEVLNNINNDKWTRFALTVKSPINNRMPTPIEGINTFLYLKHTKFAVLLEPYEVAELDSSLCSE